MAAPEFRRLVGHSSDSAQFIQRAKRAISRLGGIETHTQRLGNIVLGVFTPVLAKHTKSFNLIDTLSVGVDQIRIMDNRYYI
jgi:hypothetical protein